MPREPSTLTKALRHVHNTLVAILLCVGLGVGLYQLHYHPETPLPDEWNVTVPLGITDPLSPLTPWKLRQALVSAPACLAALEGHVGFETLSPRGDQPECSVPNRVRLGQIGSVDVGLDETSCAIALRTAMWIEHGVQPAARDILGSDVRQLIHIGSYNCRRIRTSSGSSSRWSTHATANALDVAGFDTADGRRIRLLQDWDAGGVEAAFLRAVHESSCRWYRTTLGPDFNSLHADHFHLQHTGWGTCR